MPRTPLLLKHRLLSSLFLFASSVVLRLSFFGVAADSPPKLEPKYPFRVGWANDHLPWYQLKNGEFPPHHSDKRIGGELVQADFIHRTGQFRMNKTGELMSFTMPPYGAINHLNAEADLRDVPLGTSFLFFLNQDPNGNFTRLEAHKSDPNCAACHLKIDPLGLAFENYDAIGRWRTEEALKEGAGANPKVDPSGELNDGRKFSDANGLKQILLHDADKFAAACTEKLATYAMRRAPNFGDRNDLKHITEQAKANDYKIMTLIESFVTSDLFQKR